MDICKGDIIAEGTRVIITAVGPDISRSSDHTWKIGTVCGLFRAEENGWYRGMIVSDDRYYYYQVQVKILGR